MASELKVDTISEKTSANGVVIDGVTLKDSKIGGTITIPGSTGTMALTSDISAGGLEEADIWWMTANLTTDANPITANLSRANATLNNYLGTGMTVSSGIWTFPSTGYYEVSFQTMSLHQTNSHVMNIYIYGSDDNFSTEDEVAQAQNRGNNGEWENWFISTIVKITDVSNDKVKFRMQRNSAGTFYGNASGRTSFIFKKLGDI
jgi:hypothetical protein